MVNVVVAGLPRDVKIPKFMNFLKKVVFRCKKEIHVNYIKHLSETYKQISISTNYKDALKAKKIMNGFGYTFAKQCYTLECWLENLDEEKINYVPGVNIQENKTSWKGDDRQEERGGKRMDREEVRGVERMDYEPPRKSRRYSKCPVRLRSPPRSRSRSRSRSPHHYDELEAIELKIELIRKQRILMEEETKLLLEKRKLEYLQNLGSNNFGNLAKFEEACKRNNASEISDFLTSAESSQAGTLQKPSKLPGFIGPCKEITGQMKGLIRAHSEINNENGHIFWNLLRTSVKKRLTIILEGKSYMPTKGIVSLYRVRYPQVTDPGFVEEIWNTVKTSCWPERPKKAEPVANVTEGQSTEAENPPADLTRSEENENHASEDASQLIDPDDYIDVNEVEDWVEDDGNDTGNLQDNAEKSCDTGEPNAATGDGNVPQGDSEVAATTETEFEEVEESVLYVDDADKFKASELTEYAGEGKTTADAEEGQTTEDAGPWTDY
ncbi:uncharacterized protein [Maniola hyperantus]|uniref:uncharacterized protein isoform X2 n=1 Tax=Aphantopus hyperantus TaxID=2795564 RepID=UPI00374A629D